MERKHCEITRWRRERGDVLNNYVPLPPKLCDELDQKGVEAFPPEVVQRIDAHLATFGDVPLGYG